MSDTSTTRLQSDVCTHPWNFSFLQVCRWMEARAAHLPRIGEELHPQEACLRLGQTPSTAFAPREIAAAALKGGQLHLSQYALGLYGPGGPLPLHITEEIHERELQNRDTNLADFLDMFHHRWLSLFYRAWACGQSAAGLDRPDDERFSLYVAALMGHAPPRHEASGGETVPAHARLAAAGHLVRHSRNPAGVVATLERYFGMTFRLEEYGFQWLQLEEDDRVRLGRGFAGHALGRGAVLGRHVPDRQYLVLLHATPPSLEAYERLLPGGDWHARLRHWIRCFTGLELRWELCLSLNPAEVPPCRLGGGARLGRTGWLGFSLRQTPLKGRSSAA